MRVTLFWPERKESKLFSPVQFGTFWYNHEFGSYLVSNSWYNHCMTNTHQITGYLLGGIFKYGFNFIHLFFSKVNYSEVNSPILLNAHFPREQRQIGDLSLKVAFFNNLHPLGKEEQGEPWKAFLRAQFTD